MKITAKDISKIIIGILVFFAIIKLQSVIVSVLLAVIVASFIEPLVLFFKKNGLNRSFSAILAYFLIISIFTAFFFFAVPPLLKQSINALNSLPDTIKTSSLLDPIQKNLYKNVKNFFPDIPTTISLEDLITLSTSYFSNFAGGVFDTFNRFFSSIVYFILVLVLSIYLSMEERGVARFLKLVSPKEYEKYIIDLWTRVQKKIGLWMQGQIVLMGIVFLVVFVSLSVLKIFLGDKVQNIFLISLIAGFMEIIPILGTFVSTIVAFLLTVVSGGIPAAFIVLIIFTIIHQIESNVIYPSVMKKIIGIPSVIVIIALVAGVELAGFVGVILSIPLAVLIIEFLDDKRHREHMIKEEETL